MDWPIIHESKHQFTWKRLVIRIICYYFSVSKNSAHITGENAAFEHPPDGMLAEYDFNTYHILPNATCLAKRVTDPQKRHSRFPGGSGYGRLCDRSGGSNHAAAFFANKVRLRRAKYMEKWGGMSRE